MGAGAERPAEGWGLGPLRLREPELIRALRGTRFLLGPRDHLCLVLGVVREAGIHGCDGKSILSGRSSGITVAAVNHLHYMAHLQTTARDHRNAITIAVAERELGIAITVHAIEDVALYLRRASDAVLSCPCTHAHIGVRVETDRDGGATRCGRGCHGRSVTRGCVDGEILGDVNLG